MTGLPLNAAKNLAFYDVTIDLNTSVLCKAGKQVPLGPRPFEVLLYLIENRERVVTKQELFEKVWGVEFVTDAALTQTIKDIRLALGDDAQSPMYIRTVHRKGYQFIAPLNDNTQSANRRWRLLQLGLGIFLVGFLITAISLWIKSAEPQYPRNAIAVLAFVNMSDDPANEYFSDGISEELLNLLASIPDLRVIARTSSFSFKGKEATIADIARELNVAYILEGSVRKHDNRVRVTAQLIETDSETHVWSDTYDRTLEDIFTIQNEIAGKVVQSLKVMLLDEDAPKSHETDPEAYVLFLQCRHFGAGSLEELRKGEQFCRQSLELDPLYAPAWAVLAIIQHNLAIKGYIDFKDGYERGLEFTRHALELDPTLARVHRSLGWHAMMYERDLPTAAAHYRTALELAPGDAGVLSGAAVFAETLGRFYQAIEISDRALTVNPLSYVIYGNVAIVHCWVGQFEMADERFEKALELRPSEHGNPWRAKCYLLQGKPEKALAEAESIDTAPRRLWVQSMAYYDMGQRTESNRALQELIMQYPNEAASFIAENYAWRGELDQAFKWLNRAIDEKQYMWGSLVFDPAFSKLHADPRWADIRARDGRSEEQLRMVDF